LAKSLLNFWAIVAGKLEMLLLVVADRHVGRVIEQNVGGHQVRIDIKPADAFSRSLPAFSLNWVMRFSQPSRATQLKIRRARHGLRPGSG